MSLQKLVEFASNKAHFKGLGDYIGFSRRFLAFLASKSNFQAEIVSQNEDQYIFYQYKKDGYRNITRPINSKLMISPSESDRLGKDFLEAFDNAHDLSPRDAQSRQLICNSIYTIRNSLAV